MMDASQQVEKKLGMSLDELIAQQRTKQAKRTTKKPPAAKSKTLAKGNGRVLVVPRPKNVPRPGRSAAAATLSRTRGGGVQKGGGGQAPKYASGRQQQQQQQQQGGRGSRSVRVTIGNRTRSTPRDVYPATSGGGGRGGRAPMLHLGPGASLSARFDTIGGVHPQAGQPRPTGAPRRNAHGVLVP